MNPRPAPSPHRRRRGGPLRGVVLAAVVLLLPGAVRAQTIDAEKLVKVQAAFLLNFLRLTTWPPPEAGDAGDADPLEVLVAGAPRVAAAFEAGLRGRPVHGRRVAVSSVSFPNAAPTPEMLASVGERLAGAQVLFLGDVPPAWRPGLAGLLLRREERARPRLVVTGQPWGAQERASHLSFTLRDGRVAFLLSMSAVEASPLTLSSKLMALAERLP